MAMFALGGGVALLSSLGIVHASAYAGQEEPLKFKTNSTEKARRRADERAGNRTFTDDDPPNAEPSNEEPSFEERVSGGKASPSPSPPSPSPSTSAPSTSAPSTPAPTTGDKHTDAPSPEQQHKETPFFPTITQRSIKDAILKGQQEKLPRPRVTQQIKRLQPGEAISMVDTRVTSNNVRLVQLARANYIQEVNKYNTSF